MNIAVTSILQITKKQFFTPFMDKLPQPQLQLLDLKNLQI